MDAAEQLILRKGSLNDRRQLIADMQRDVLAQEQDLKQDYYHLYSIALCRFHSDSAMLYLKFRHYNRATIHNDRQYNSNRCNQLSS